MSNEHILVVNADALASRCVKDGLSMFTEAFTPHTDELADIVFDQLQEHLAIIWRPRAEKELPDAPTTHRQFINYGLLTQVDEAGVKRYGVYRRVKGTAENRLLGRYSIGFGGHPSIDDCYSHEGEIGVLGTLVQSLYRELKEEVGLDGDGSSFEDMNLVGYIHSVQSEVDSLHFAVVTEVELKRNAKIQARESSMQFMGFFTTAELKSQAVDNEFENWSKFIIDVL